MKYDSSKPFELPLLPPSLNFRDERFIDSMLNARTELGELNGYAHALPNPLLLLSPAVIRESVASSSIENINTTMEEALQAQLFPETEQKKSDKEVLHYRDAIMWGYENLDKIPISTRLILGIHKNLLPDGSPGYRKMQNQIVNTGTDTVVYTPPSAHELPRLLGNWEKFVNNSDDRIDPLVKVSHLCERCTAEIIEIVTWWATLGTQYGTQGMNMECRSIKFMQDLWGIRRN
jgi:Fic family protein